MADKHLLTTLEHYKGVMFKSKKELEGNRYIFWFAEDKTESVHTFFCSCTLQISFYHYGKLVDYVILKPYKIYKPHTKYDKIIEVAI